MASKLIHNIVLGAVACALCACHTIDDDRIPSTPVYINFSSQGMWDTYGVGGALETRRFIKSDRIPANYPYAAGNYTGYGGVLLVCDFTGNFIAYDLACPVECKATTRVQVDTDANIAVCPTCHSTFAIFENYGYPLSGKAADYGYGLRRYYVVQGTSDYRVITR
jgi:hypothetical protein